MELSKNYLPQATEEKWNQHWKNSGYFSSVPDERPSYTVVIPPPNVTGVLHMGHTLNETVQDILVRKARMSGFNACWVPGSDHASIATESKVVQMLKEQGIDKNTLSRDEFLKYAFEWKEKYGGIIYSQIERLGCSVDWKRVTFTMDDHYYKAVIKVFVDLYGKGLIYRGARMINWDPAAKTALSDEEVEFKDLQGTLYYIKYQVADELTDVRVKDDSKEEGTELTELRVKDDSKEAGTELTDVRVKDDSREAGTELIDVKVTDENKEAGKELTDVRVTDGSKEAGTELIDVSVTDDSEENEQLKKVDGLSSNDQPSTTNRAFITIATQRPETIMGDTAIAVNPLDPRYAHLKGKFAIVPLINRRIPIIFDDYVDASFGTGALKVTPAHDINDYNLGLKHNLEVVDTLNEDGTLSAAAQIYVGEDRFTARKKIVVELTEKGYLQKQEQYQTRLGYSQRSGAVVEPRISTQWFVKTKELGIPALEAVVNGEINIHPGDKFLATYKYWLENVKDWCISRQLWWGQQIPAWYDEEGNVYVGESKEEAVKAANDKLQAASENGLKLEASSLKLTQDEDVLDTWFSSWLWPMEVFKGISDPGNKELDYYYPTKVLVTGQDIIFFWVARMIMAGMHYKNLKPFNDVYFTGMVRDKQGRKMSKTLGNSPDLLELIDRFGADAVRFGIMISSPAGNDMLFDEASLEQGKLFNNKIWNALKLVKMWEGRQVAGKEVVATNEVSAVRDLQAEADMLDEESDTRNFAVTWFENRLSQVREDMESMYSQFKLSEALKTVYSLIWDDFCSWYLEWVKPGFEQPIDAEIYKKTISIFEELMQMLHPFMPFITEEIYHLLAERNILDDLAIKQFTAIIPANKHILQEGDLLKKVISSIRDARNKNQVKPKEAIKLSIVTDDRDDYRDIELILAKQVNADSIFYVTSAPANSIVVAVEKDKFYFETGHAIDSVALRQELEKDLEHQQLFLTSVTKKLSNERFVANARPEVVELEQKKQADALARIKAIEESLAGL